MPKTHTLVTDPAVWEIVGERRMLMPPTSRKTWTNSRLVVTGEGETTPLLVLLAEHKFGPWDPKLWFPVWADKDWRNESLDNVRLVEKAIPRERAQKNDSGYPAGTAGYYKHYRKKNPERVKKWAHNSYVKRASIKKQLEEAQAEIAKLRPPQPVPVPPPQTPLTISNDEMFSKLQAILGPEGGNETNLFDANGELTEEGRSRLK